MSARYWQTSRFKIDLSRPRVMGIVNLTPDSFSDGGLDAHVQDSVRRCERMIAEGADILDLGAESTRPGATPLAAKQEQARLLPVLREVLRWGVPVSVDTYKPEVMQVALDLGADIINDIWALRWSAASGPSATEVVAAHPACGVCLMHMHLEPTTMQVAPMQGSVASPVLDFLQQRLVQAQAAGLAFERLAIDPGIGFGKTVEQNFELLREQVSLKAPGSPLVIGWSRKSSLAHVGHKEEKLAVGDRLVPSVAAAVLAAERGADVLRVHDVRETVQALKLLSRIR